MEYRDTAIQAIDSARLTLRGLLADALSAEAFSDVSAIARAAESLSAVATELRGAGEVPLPAEKQPREALPPPSAAGTVLAIAETSQATTPLPVPPPTNRRQQYPQYFRAGDRLVKRAWSKKERQPYEHKAPREVIEVLLEAIRRRKGDQRPFEAADIMPLYSKSGDEYPSYQSYLALGWLRHAGAIAKGRDGYLLKRGWDPGRVAQLWETLPAAAA